MPERKTSLVDVLANDGLEDPATVRLLLVDPAARAAEPMIVTKRGFGYMLKSPKA